tara:strand:+ start:2601 stop:2753 length:153 start_codon:yes stop_codon:yes gene_type:complete
MSIFVKRGSMYMINFYKELLNDGIIQIDGAAHQRLKYLETKFINDKIRKN